MARANCQLSAIFCVLVCLSPVGATPITMTEFQRDDSIAEAIRWASFTQIYEMSRPVEIRARNESTSTQPTTENNTVIPESGSLILLGIGLAGLAALMKKKAL